MTPTVSSQGLLERVRTLEAQNRRWKIASFVVVLILAASLAKGVLAQGNPQQAPQIATQTISAQSFQLKDSDGKVRGQFSMKGDKPILELYDQTGKVIWSTSAQARNAFSSELNEERLK